MTREEFESILEEAYIEGYNTAIEDIQEDILDEEAYDLEDEYEYYNESISSDDKRDIRKLIQSDVWKKMKDKDPIQYRLAKRVLIADKAENGNKKLAKFNYENSDTKHNYANPNCNTKDTDYERYEQKTRAANRMEKAANRNQRKLNMHRTIQREKDYINNNF